MAEAYLSARDRDMRLDRTICLWDGRPVYVLSSGLSDPHQVSISPLKKPGQLTTTVNYTDPRFSYEAFHLGYINLPNNAHYLSRVPSRSQKQGLTVGQISMRPFDPGASYLYTSAMEKCILGEHPVVEEAYKDIQENDRQARAFSRHLCLRMMDRDRMFLEYRGRTIGWQKNKDEMLFSVFPSTDNALLTRLLKANNVPYKIE